MSKRTALINQLKDTINEHNGSSLSLAQVEHWVGSDASESEIDEHISDFRYEPDNAVTPEDILSLWEDCHA